MRYTVIGDEAILELTRDDLRALLAKLDDEADCTLVGHDDNAVWKVIEVVAAEDEPARSVDKTALSALTVDSCDIEPHVMDRGE